VSGETAIEVVRGRLGGEREERLLAFWAERGALEGDAARERLPEVLCLALDESGEITGVNSAYAGPVDPVGGRRFWVYRSLLAGDEEGLWTRMFNAAFEALEDGAGEEEAAPVGLCAPIGGRAEIERRPEAVWSEEELIFAGYLDDGTQLRIRYFWDAAIAPGIPESPSLEETKDHDYPLEDRYRIEPLGGSDAVGPEDVLALWEREGAVPEAEARRRVHEVHLVAIDRDDGAVGISSAYLQRHPALRMDLWYYRAYVARAHRNSSLAGRLALSGRDHLEQRFVSGEDTRAAGIVYEVENEGLKSFFNRALWLPTGFTFIGENERGDHVRVHYFPGARVPLPPGDGG
jgi:hypothetical protein